VASYETNPNSGTNIEFNQGWGESFKPAQSVSVTRVALFMGREGPTPGGPLDVQVRADNGSGAPGAILASASTTPSNIPTDQFISFDVSPGASLVTGTTYYLTAVTTSGAYSWDNDLNGGYAGGQMYISQNNGASWIPVGPGDFLFQVFGCPLPTPTPTSTATPTATGSGS